MDLNRDKRDIKHIITFAVNIITVISLAWYCVYAFCPQAVNTGQSMLPILEDGDTVLYNRMIYHLKKPSRLDIIVFTASDKKTFIKRIIGLPGETVQIMNDMVYIDGKELKVSRDLARSSLAGIAEMPIKLGEDEYFVLGDNREAGEDSRSDKIGNIKKEEILGKVWIRTSPLVHLKLIK